MSTKLEIGGLWRLLSVLSLMSRWIRMSEELTYSAEPSGSRLAQYACMQIKYKTQDFSGRGPCPRKEECWAHSNFAIRLAWERYFPPLWWLEHRNIGAKVSFCQFPIAGVGWGWELKLLSPSHPGYCQDLPLPAPFRNWAVSLCRWQPVSAPCYAGTLCQIFLSRCRFCFLPSFGLTNSLGSTLL